MQSLDRSLLRLTEATERSALLTPAVGNRILHAAFIVHNVEVGDVTGVTVRDVDLLPSVERVEAAVIHPLNGMRWEETGSRGVATPHAADDARVELLLTCETTRVESTEVVSDLSR